MHQALKRREHTSHLWVILFTTLALAALGLFETSTTRRASTGAASAPEPILSLPGGYYDRDIQLEISAPTPEAHVIFTLDGRVPTHDAGTVYTRPILMSATTPAVTVVRARAVLPGGALGPVVSASYFVGLPATLPLLSLIVEPGDLWDAERGIYANPLEKGRAWERPVDVTFVDQDRHAGFHVPAGIRIHGHYSRVFDKKGLRLYFRREYGPGRLDYPLFADSPVSVFNQLVLHNSGQDCYFSPQMNWTLIRNQLADRLALELGGYAPRNRAALLFINGESWGIYQLRERINDDFLADHYGIASADLLDAPEYIGEQDILMGDREHWDHLMRFIETHDMAEPAHYAYVQTQVDVPEFIDYNVLQIYAANTDWPRLNVRQFRPHVQGGRWHWTFWDSDHGFGAALWSFAGSNLIAQMLDDNPPETGGRDVLLLRKLLENPVFLEQFLSRTAHLLNTTLAPPAVIAHIDALAAEIAPDIGYEITRWPGSSWEPNVQNLRDFAQRRPDFVRQHAVERFGLSGTVQLAFNPPASGSGYVAVNGSLLRDLPWQGVYFQDLPLQITAAPAPGYRFAGWDPTGLPQTPAITLTLQASQTLTPRFAALDDDAPRPGDVVFQTGANGPGGENWFELKVMRPGGVDLRGWRVTDNDTKRATDEGSLIFATHPALARVPRGTTIRVNLVQSPAPQDDLNAWDRQMVLYTANGNLDAHTDPGFRLWQGDNLVLLAPGPTPAFGDDQGIAFAAAGRAVTPASFGVLADGVLPASETTAAKANDQGADELLILAALVVVGVASTTFKIYQTRRFYG
jgi:hypothetical protein